MLMRDTECCAIAAWDGGTSVHAPRECPRLFPDTRGAGQADHPAELIRQLIVPA